MNARAIAKHIPGASRLYHRLKPRPSYVDGGEALSQQLQQVILGQHRAALRQNVIPFDEIGEAGFRCNSQFEEDGIILYILAAIGMKTRSVVEMCCGNGSECMATNLILNHGYKGYLFEGGDKNFAAAQGFFRTRKDCLLNQPELRKAWITRDNVNDLLRDAGASGEVDVFSLDMDGNDYWIWEAVDEINPRLCVFEIHNLIPGDLSLTVPYSDGFDYLSGEGDRQWFRSVSLEAMRKLSAKKGYRLIGSHKHGFNVFFLRNDIAPNIFPEVSIESVQQARWTREQEKLWPRIKDMGWVEV